MDRHVHLRATLVLLALVGLVFLSALLGCTHEPLVCLPAKVRLSDGESTAALACYPFKLSDVKSIERFR